MKFKDLTEAQIEYAKSVYQNKELSWDDRMNLLVKFFGKSERTARKWCCKIRF
jgi:urease accessory protein UreH